MITNTNIAVFFTSYSQGWIIHSILFLFNQKKISRKQKTGIHEN